MRQEDYVNKLAEYVKKNVAKGYTLDSLRWALIDQKHSRTVVEKSIELAEKQLAAAAPKMEVPKKEKFVEIEQPEPEQKKGFFARLFGR